MHIQFQIATVLLMTAMASTAGTVMEMSTTLGSGDPQQHRIEVESGNLRLGVAGDPETEVIYRSDRDALAVIDHERRSYMVLDQAAAEGLRAQIDSARVQMERALADLTPQQRAMMEQMMMGRMPDVAAQPDRIEVTQLGDGGEIAGIATRRVQVSRNGQPERNVWVAPWSAVGDANQLRSSFESMSGLMQRMLEGLPGTDRLDNPYRLLERLDGLPLRTEELDANGAVELRSEVISVREEEIPAARFDPPADYSVEQLPQ